MKRSITVLSGIIALTLTTYSCKDSFLDQTPLGVYSEPGLANQSGVDGALVMAYSSLRGTGGWYSSATNWLWGSIRGHDSYKGSESTDQAGEINPVERYETTSSTISVPNKWQGSYDGIGQANVVLRLMKQATDIPDAAKKVIEAEARFIRGFHHFEAKRAFNNIPFVPETATTTADFKALTNDKDVWPQIMEDLIFAYNNLPETQSQLGRVNKWAAAAYVGKAYLYQKNYTEAKKYFDMVIASGKTNSGEKYGLLDNYGDIFKGENDNSKEFVFAIQYTVGDGNQGNNGSAEMELTNPNGSGPGGCCGFFQPSQNLVNAYKTDANGLPLLDTYNASDINNFEANPTAPTYAGTVDPRLDWSVGRIGIPYLDWGPAQTAWIRNLANGGPYLPKKTVHYKAEAGKYQAAGGWGQSRIGKNYPLMRYADVLLMAAEAEVEAGTLTKALDYVNQVRKRAANPAGFVKKLVDEKDPTKGYTTENAANYVIKEYPTSAFASKDAAHKIIRFERRLELAMEGHRFFDLVRWGIADTEINAYLQTESKKRSHLANTTFTKGQDEYLPIPINVINQSKTADGKQGLKQNPGY
ncbi:RagB/SusD family nutrient uptake outer membrane protein [Tellurirhabdus rosea]|uniref:RagB/SusD family nutrient uptake outer membrane protein n=1 Tax=Tellurirhabdus rosea TaxID=2674997 RepID=UPI0022575B83|nr:RagB/SusD family nutrient uptake outer membrane protein [Tellurirhabdus rosea]